MLSVVTYGLGQEKGSDRWSKEEQRRLQQLIQTAQSANPGPKETSGFTNGVDWLKFQKAMDLGG